MPGRTPLEAHQAFITPLKETLGCVTWTRITLDEKPIELGVEKALTLGAPRAPVELNGRLADGSHPALFVGIEYRIIHDPEEAAGRQFRVTTDKYTYHLYSSAGEEVLLYHWHPDTRVDLPHLHIGEPQLAPNPNIQAKTHVPTGRVALESLVLFVIDELGVVPIHDTYREIILRHLKNFVANRSWHG